MASVALARRREQERVLLERQLFLKENARADCAAKWEKRTFDKIEQRDILTRIKKLADHDDEEIEEKRNQIRTLYERELNEWKEMVCNLQSKLIEERELNFRDKALKLKEKREQEKLDFAKACYDRRWRESSDQARTLVAQSTSEQLMKDRNEAMYWQSLKDSSQDFNSGKRDEIGDRYSTDEERETQENLYRKYKNSDIRSALDQQMKDLKLKDEIETKKKLEDERALLEKWRTDTENEKIKETEALLLARCHGTETLQSNVDRLKKANEMKRLGEERDKLLLQYALEKEKTELENEKSHKVNQMDACKGYILTLQEQIVKDQEDLELTEKYRVECSEELLKRGDLELKSQNDDRRRRMTEINKTRKEQIDEKDRLIREEKAALKKFNTEKLAQIDRQSQFEEEQRKKKQDMTIQTMLCNKELAQMKAVQRLKEKQENMSKADFEREEQKEKEKLDRLTNQLSNRSR